MFGSTRQAVAASQPGNLKLRRGSSASSRRLWGDQRDSDRVPRRSSSPPLPVAIPVPASGCQCALALRLASHGPRGRAGRVRVGGWQLESVKPESGAQSAGTRSRGRRGACWSQAWSKGPVFLLFIWFRWSSCRNLCVQRRWAHAATTSFDVHIGMDDVPHLCVIMPVRPRRLAARDTAAKRCRAGLQRDAVAHRGCSGHAQAGPRYVMGPHRATCPPGPPAIVALVLQAMAGGLN